MNLLCCFQDFIGAAADRAAANHATLHDGAGGTARAIQLPLWPDNTGNGLADVLNSAVTLATGNGNVAGGGGAAAGGAGGNANSR